MTVLQYNSTQPYNADATYDGALASAVVACPAGIVETDVYISPDGEEYPLHNPPNRSILTEEGFGMPSIDYITQRGPFQHGVSLIDHFLQPRIVQYVIRNNFTSRSNYWNGRTTLLNILRPGRTGLPAVGYLQRRLTNGDSRRLDVLIQQGPKFEPRAPNRWDEWSFTETLRFVALNPILYHPTQQSLAFAPAVVQLIFPVTFPITFGGFVGTIVVSYDGTWIEYPTIEITGPLTDVVIQNVSTNENITLNTMIPAGYTVTFNLLYGQKTVTRNDGVNMIGYVSDDSDLFSFHLAPDPEVVGGLNNIFIFGSDASVASAVVIRWYRRYIGL